MQRAPTTMVLMKSTGEWENPRKKVRRRACSAILRMFAWIKGRTLVRSSAQLEPFLSPQLHATTQRIPQQCSQ